MARKPPPAFLLVSQAALCAPDLVDYPQMLTEVVAGRLAFDPLLCHEGVWLLDHAIEARAKSSAGMREFRKHRAADRSMDTLWKQWMLSAPAELLGSVEAQGRRAARLAQLGSVLCLDAALTNGPSPKEVQAQADALHSPPLRSNLFVRAVKEDLRETVSVLISHGFSRQDFSLRDHPLLAVKSAPVMKSLLDAGMEPSAVAAGEKSLIDITSTRDLPSDEMIAIVEVLRASGKIQDTQEQRLARLSSNLEKKTLEQLRAEMRAAKWSPSQRGIAPSPIVEWARSAIISPSSMGSSSSGAALSWLSKQSGVGVAQPGQNWSEAIWLWAVHMVFNPADCHSFSSLAEDLPADFPQNRFLFLQSFLSKEDLPCYYLEKAVGRGLQGVCSRIDRVQLAVCRLFDDLFQETDGKAWILGAYANKVDRSPDLSSVLTGLLSWPDQEQNLSRWMSLALVVAYVQEDESLFLRIRQAWGDGIRPLSGSLDRASMLSRVSDFDPELASVVQSWDLSHVAKHAGKLTRGVRL